MNKFHFLICFISLLTSCTNSDEANNQEEITVALFPEFENFPQSLYYDLTFDFDEDQLNNFLNEQEFVLSSEAGSNYYFRINDSTELILPANKHLNSFKLVLKGQKYLSHFNELIEIFKSKSTESSLGKEFSIFTVIDKSGGFKLTVFCQENFIRLHFINKRSV